MTSLHKLLTLLIFISTTPVYSLDVEAENLQKSKLVRYIINKVSWPSGSIPKNTFTICALGNAKDLNIVEKLNGQVIQKRRVVVKPFKAKDSASTCQLIYIGEGAVKEQKTLIQNFAKQPVLLLGGMEHFAALGGTMNFVVLENSVALTLNLESMKKSQLVMASEELDNVIVVPEAKDLN
jgi:hypothetical protein